MTLVKFKNDLHPMHKLVNDTFDALLRDDFSSLGQGNFGYMPPVNVKEGKDNFQVELLAPGRNKNDFNIKLEKDLLTISSKVEKNTEESNDKWTRKEFTFSSFSRTFNLPDSADASKIAAEYADGVLKLSIPKKEESKDKGPVEIKIS